MAEILSRSRKVRSQIPNKTNFVTARDDGTKGQRLLPDRAGAGLASPAGIGAGADMIVSRRDYINQPGVDAERLRRVVIAN